MSVQSANLSAPSLTFCLVAVWSLLLSCYNLACRRRDRSDRHSSGKNHWALQVAAAYVHHVQELTFELYASFFFPSSCRCLQARLTRVRFLGAAFVSKRSREKKKKRNRAVTVQQWQTFVRKRVMARGGVCVKGQQRQTMEDILLPFLLIEVTTFRICNRLAFRRLFLSMLSSVTQERGGSRV